ncbi:type IV pilin protein [Hydrogenophaga sp. OTU3427]|uniref:type IV pilin protein n=1 Tax=Hydrogenophaga sp. OTU3427 TaxID=3043856 RepID=UPI00313DA5B1
MDTIHRLRRQRGFSLVEAMVVVAVIGILAAIAYPNYTEHVRRGRRSDAMVALSAVLQAQERWRANTLTYAAQLQDLGLRSTSLDGHYALALNGASRNSYTATATAVGVQASDTACSSMSVTLDAQGIHYGATGSAGARRCWGQE